jgi:hypothetical protein
LPEKFQLEKFYFQRPAVPEKLPIPDPPTDATTTAASATASAASPAPAPPAPTAPADNPPPLASDANRESLALAIAAAGWLLPGLGHALLKMWGRALACFLTVALLVFVGAGMRGNIFSRSGEDAFTKLGYVADLGAGAFYFVARSLETNGPDVSHANGDYGTRLLATAGVLNLLAALHAYEATRGRKA